MLIWHTKVLHVRSQMETGMSLVESYMHKRLLTVCSSLDKTGNIRDSMESFTKRAFAEALTVFDSASLDQSHHIGFIDLPKLGRLSAVEIQAAATWASQVLNLNPERSSPTEK